MDEDGQELGSWSCHTARSLREEGRVRRYKSLCVGWRHRPVIPAATGRLKNEGQRSQTPSAA